MKKAIGICLALCLLSACVAQPPAAASHAVEAPAWTVKNPNVTLLTKWNGTCGGASSEEGYYYPLINPADGSFNLSYLDYATQQELFLCAAPTCTHAGESCTSWYAAGQGGLVPIVVGNRVLLISRGITFDTTNGFAQITTVERNGVNRKTLVQFDSADELLPPFVGNESNLFCIRKTVLESTEEQNNLLGVDLATGQCAALHSFGDATVAIVGACAQTIVLKQTVVQNTSAQNTLLCYHIDTDTLEEVAVWNDFERILFVAESGYGFLEPDGTVTYSDFTADATPKPLENIQFPLDAQHGLEMVDFVDSYDDKVIFRSVFMGKEPSERRDTLYGIALGEGTLRELSLKSTYRGIAEPVEMIAALENRLLVMEKKEQKDRPMIDVNGVPYTAQVLCNQYALIAKEDYWNSIANFTSIQGPWF